MDFRSAGDRVRSLIAAKKPGQLSKSALTSDPLRDNIMQEAEDRSERFRNITRQKPEVTYTSEAEDGTKSTETYEWDGFGETVRDVARASYGYDEPEMLPHDRIRPSHQFGREVLQHILSADEFDESRPYTRNNEVESMFGAMKFAQALKDKAPEVAEHLARSQEMREAEDQIDSAETMLERLRDRAKQQIAKNGEVTDKTRREVKAQVKARQAAKANLAQALQQHVSSNYVQAAADIAQAGAEAVKDAADLMGQLPGVGGGHAHNLNPETQIELAEKWAKNPQLREIARMLGRMIRDFRFKRDARTKNVPIEPVGIVTGNDIGRLVPHEMARAYMPELRPLWMKDFAERSLLEYEMAGKTPAGKGPIIEVHDGSGSMSGEKFVWASSLALTLLTCAHREKRDFAGIEFGSGGQVKSWIFGGRDELDPNEIVDFASHFYAGGTSTVGGLQEALRVMHEHPQFRTADVILVGDGQDYFREADQKVCDELRALGVRIHGITILTGANPYFEQACDWYVDVTDLAGANEATDRLAENIT